MTMFRACVLFGLLAAVALTLVHLRVEQTRYAAKTLALESRWIELRRELWQVQTSTARLRAPGRLHDRLEWFDTDLAPPASGKPGTRGTKVVFNHPQG